MTERLHTHKPRFGVRQRKAEAADDGGPAFPIPQNVHNGMSLRDWFAGKALAGLLIDEGVGGQPGDRIDYTARDAYRYADAMLAARAALAKADPTEQEG